jgi:hypothetical protein
MGPGLTILSRRGWRNDSKPRRAGGWRKPIFMPRGGRKRAAAADDWESATRPSQRPPDQVELPPSTPVVPPSRAGGSGGQQTAGLAVQVKALLEDGEGDAMLTARPVLSAHECAEWISWGEEAGFALERHAATAHIAHRDNGRLAVESPEVAAALFERLQPWVPAEVGGRRAHGCSPNLRLYRYQPGQRFGRHVDQANRVGGGVTEFSACRSPPSSPALLTRPPHAPSSRALQATHAQHLALTHQPSAIANRSSHITHHHHPSLIAHLPITHRSSPITHRPHSLMTCNPRGSGARLSERRDRRWRDPLLRAPPRPPTARLLRARRGGRARPRTRHALPHA